MAQDAVPELTDIHGPPTQHDFWCLRCLLLVMCTYPFAKKVLTLHLACGEGRERYFGCNLMQRNVLASSHQHLMAEAPNIAAQARLGKRKWHTESGYSKRSKVETTFHRYKAIVGSAMRARGLAAQRVEARIGCKILNTMTALGMPDSEMIG